jgi:hypothetical protein
MTAPRFPTVPTGALRLDLEDVAAAVRRVEGSARWSPGGSALELTPPRAVASARVAFDRDEVSVQIVLRGVPLGAPTLIRGIADPAGAPRFVRRVRAALRVAYRRARDLNAPKTE